MSEFQKWTSQHRTIRASQDWNALLDHGLEKPASYIIRKNGSYYEAINGSTGKIDYGGANNAGGVSGTDAAAVIHQAYNNLPYGRSAIQLKGRFILTSGLVFNDRTKAVVLTGEQIGVTKLDFVGVFTLIRVGEDSPSGTDRMMYCTIKNLWIDGDADTDVGLDFVQTKFCSAENLTIGGINKDNAIGIRFRSVSTYGIYNRISNIVFPGMDGDGARAVEIGDASQPIGGMEIKDVVATGKTGVAANSYGIHLYNTDAYVEGGDIETFSKGIYVRSRCSNVRINSVRLEGNTVDIEVESGANNTHIAVPSMISSSKLVDNGDNTVVLCGYGTTSKIPFGFIMHNSASVAAEDTSGNVRTLIYLDGDDWLDIGNWPGNIPIKFLGDLLKVRGRNSDPDTTGWGATENGTLWYRSDLGVFKYWDGSAIKTISTT